MINIIKIVFCNAGSLSFFNLKVHFEEVPELVANRKVFMLQGFAYVAMHQVNISACHYSTIQLCIQNNTFENLIIRSIICTIYLVVKMIIYL